jgi:hypothetical protein
MDKALRDAATQLIAAAPCSVEMPAGTGKTHLLAAAVAIAAESGNRSLVLTHTNAGVDAIRKRLCQFDVPTALFRVETITSWAFSLVGAYPGLAGISVTDAPDWTLSDSYVQGAASVAGARAVVNVHSISFDFLYVDEYQDCSLVQHDLIIKLAQAIPRTIVLGDRLQAIFGFRGNPLAKWDTHVLPVFPALVYEPVAHRWSAHSPEFGQWLLSIRPHLVSGQQFDLAAHAIPGLIWNADAGPTSIASVAYGFRNFNETVVLLDKWPSDVASHASRLGGSYSVMEDIQGRFMRDKLSTLPPQGDFRLAAWFADFAKDCVIGLSGLDTAVIGRLMKNQAITHYARAGIEQVLAALDSLRTNPTYEQLGHAKAVIRAVPTLKVYRWEAWDDTLEAIAATADNGEPAVDNLARRRERLRRTGRRSHARIASRTLLVKGLEYDHVMIADLSKMRDPRNLYVALSRARKTVTVFGGSSRIFLQDEN